MKAARDSFRELASYASRLCWLFFALFLYNLMSIIRGQQVILSAFIMVVVSIAGVLEYIKYRSFCEAQRAPEA